MSDKEKTIQDKPLEKMTATELREVAKDIPQIVGAHGMGKEELLAAIKEARGIVDEEVKTTSKETKHLKKTIRELKQKRAAAIDAKDKKMATIYKRRISRLKKQTRKVA
jgi:ABC-type uncharacterized transport system ATPase subunit